MALPLKVWTGTEWIEVGSNAGQVYYSANTPTYAGVGDIWVESDSDNSVLSPSNFLTISSASTTYATKTSPVFDGTANFSNASVIFNSASVSGLSSGGATINDNLLYNGAMQVSQRGTSTASITTNGYYTADRWQAVLSSLGTWTQTLENDAPTGTGFRKSLKMLCTTADASPAAGDYVFVVQYLEGQDLQRIAKGTSAAQQLTMSFWVKSNVIGTYIVELIDNDNTRVVSASYTISASATWERKTVTFPADTTGAFDNDNALSFGAQFWLGAGSNFTSGSPLQTTWGTATNTRATGQTNLAAATNNYWQVTGVKLEIGTSATDYDFKPFQEDLRECQRYFEKSYSINVVAGTNTVYGLVQGINGTDGNQINGIRWIVPKRTTPTTSIYSKTGTVATLSTTNYADAVNSGSWNISDANEFGFRCIVGTGGLTSGAAYNYHYICSAEL